MSVAAIFKYTPSQSSNRRATGSFWRGHKLHAFITLPLGCKVFRAMDHAETTLRWGNDTYDAQRICRADGEVMDDKWFFTVFGESFYVMDRDVASVNTESARIINPGRLAKRLKRTMF